MEDDAVKVRVASMRGKVFDGLGTFIREELAVDVPSRGVYDRPPRQLSHSTLSTSILCRQYLVGWRLLVEDVPVRSINRSQGG